MARSSAHCAAIAAGTSLHAAATSAGERPSELALTDAAISSSVWRGEAGGLGICGDGDSPTHPFSSPSHSLHSGLSQVYELHHDWQLFATGTFGAGGGGGGIGSFTSAVSSAAVSSF